MTTPKPEISRRQAWCKLAMLIAEGLPAPMAIRFSPSDGRSITIDLDGRPAFDAWVAALALGTVHPAILATAETEWIHGAWDYWFGFHTHISACTPALYAEFGTEDMDAVRAIATEADHCACSEEVADAACPDHGVHAFLKQKFAEES